MTELLCDVCQYNAPNAPELKRHMSTRKHAARVRLAAEADKKEERKLYESLGALRLAAPMAPTGPGTLCPKPPEELLLDDIRFSIENRGDINTFADAIVGALRRSGGPGGLEALVKLRYALAIV